MKSDRYEPSNNDINLVVDAIIKKLEQRLTQKGRGIFVSSHEILGIITEEVQEFCDSVKANNSVEQEKELIDIAVGAIYGVVSIRSKKMDWL